MIFLNNDMRKSIIVPCCLIGVKGKYIFIDYFETRKVGF